MKIQIDLDEELVRVTAADAVKKAFAEWNGAGKHLVARAVESYLTSQECEEKVKAIVDRTAESFTKSIVEEAVNDAIGAIARRHAKFQAKVREAEIISAVGKQMELKGGG